MNNNFSKSHHISVPVESRDDADEGYQSHDGRWTHVRLTLVREDGEVYGWRETAGAYRTRLTDTAIGRRALELAAQAEVVQS